MTNQDYFNAAHDIAQDLLTNNPEATEEELREWFGERAHEEAESATIYYSRAAEIIENAWGTDINYAEQWLDGLYGESIYEGCDSYGAVQCRLAYALVYCGLEDKALDAIEAVWETAQAKLAN